MKEHYGCEVIAVMVDVGRAGDLEVASERAMAAGAADARVIDAVDEFADEYIARVLKANALYEQKYPLVSALSRPLICKLMVDIAREYDADAVAHGCTGKGNDQVRFTLGLIAGDPDLEILAPARDWGFTRDDAIAYAARLGIPVTASKENPYSIDQNLWGRSIECGVLEDPWEAPPSDIYEMTAGYDDALDEPRSLTVTFEKGVPVALDGEDLSLRSIVERVGDIAGEHGFGRVDMVENRLIGIKSREIYESPAGLALIEAHRHLEDLVLDRPLTHFKYGVEQGYAELVYDGLWFSPLQKAFDAFIDSSQEHVSGDVRLRLHKGSCIVEGRRSESSLYSLGLATYDKGDQFSHESAAGFLDLYGLPMKVWAEREKRSSPG